MLVERRFAYRSEIKVSPADLESARRGRKSCTIRLGTAEVEGKDIDLTDGRGRLRVRVTRVDTTKTFDQLGPEEASGEGFQSKEELRADLRRYYRGLEGAQPMTVIWFSIV